MSEKLKILVVSYFFAPNNVIGAVRPSKIVEKLSKLGYDIDVFTYGYIGDDSYADFKSNAKIYRINDMKIKKNNVPKANESSFITRFKRCVVMRPIAKFYYDYVRFKQDKMFIKKFIELYNDKLKNNNYSAVFTTFGPFSPILVGMYLKKITPHIRWVCDFRDPAIVKGIYPLLYIPKRWNLQRKACRMADAIIAVSNGYLKRICRGKYQDKSFMIPNGFDLKDRPTSDSKIIADKLKLTYVGVLYGGKRDLRPVFRAIRELLDENKIDYDKIVFEYAGKEFNVIYKQAEQYGMQKIINDNGLLSRKDCIDLQFSSHALILSTWNEKGEEGVFPGKFLEYMMIGRPIISVVDGNLGNSEVSQVIREGNLGISYEAANKGNDSHVLKSYIYDLYNVVIKNKIIEFNPNSEVLNRYNYDNIVKKIEGVISDGR